MQAFSDWRRPWNDPYIRHISTSEGLRGAHTANLRNEDAELIRIQQRFQGAFPRLNN